MSKPSKASVTIEQVTPKLENFYTTRSIGDGAYQNVKCVIDVNSGTVISVEIEGQADVLAIASEGVRKAIRKDLGL